MPRSDVKPLSYLELESFLENIEKDTAQAVSEPLGATEPESEPQPELTHCPHCSTRLSSLDNKLGQCMACNRSLDGAASGTDRPDRRPVSIGI